MPARHSLGGHDRSVGGITDRDGPCARFPRPRRASGFGPQTKGSSHDVQPADQLRRTCGDQRLAYPRPFQRRAATDGIHPNSDESPVPSSMGGLSADRLDPRGLDVRARKPNGAAGFRCPFARDGEHEAGQPWDAANVGWSGSADSAGAQGRQTERQEACDSERQTAARYVPNTETDKLMHAQTLACRRAARVSGRCAPSLGERESPQLRNTRLQATTRERLAQRSRDSSFAMAKRASGASEHGRVLVVQLGRLVGYAGGAAFRAKRTPERCRDAPRR
jgi:hypothetical protein